MYHVYGFNCFPWHGGTTGGRKYKLPADGSRSPVAVRCKNRGQYCRERCLFNGSASSGRYLYGGRDAGNRAQDHPASAAAGGQGESGKSAAAHGRSGRAYRAGTRGRCGNDSADYSGRQCTGVPDPGARGTASLYSRKRFHRRGRHQPDGDGNR